MLGGGVEGGRDHSGPPSWDSFVGRCFDQIITVTGIGEVLCGGLLRPRGEDAMKKVTHTIPPENSFRLSRCMMMMLAGASIVPSSLANEVCEKGGPDGQPDSSMVGDLGWLLVLAGLVCFLHLLKEIGMEAVRRLFSGQENLEVKLLSPEAICPQKGSSEAAGWDLSTTMAVISTGLALEIPKGCYGRISSRSSLASQGLDVAGGVIDADYRGEVKVILVNRSSSPKQFDVGDGIAQVIIERIACQCSSGGVLKFVKHFPWW